MAVSHDSPAASAPTLKTLLMCDLVVSTQLVEQVGDALAADQHWLAHGSYLLKGVEQAVEVFEVGSPGVAPGHSRP